MLFVWLFIAISLTISGAVITALLDDAAVEHDEELTYAQRINEQRAAIEAVRCKKTGTCKPATRARRRTTSTGRSRSQTPAV